jgi:flagellar hook-associated protein 3 FlgL
MRVSNQLLINELLAGLNQNRSELALVNRQLSTQRVVNQPSDNPGAYATSRDLEARIRRNELYQSNVEQGIEEARIAADTIDQMQEQLREVKRLAIQGANDTLDDTSMEVLADRVAGVRSSIVQLANKSYNGRFLFSGTATQTQPFSESGSTVSYDGNDEDLVIGISENTTLATSVNGEDLFTFNTSDDVFELLNRVETALRNNDRNSVSAELTAIDDAISSVASHASQLGNTVNRMEFAYYDYQSSNLGLTSNVSRMVDTDYAEAISRLQNLDVAYQAAMTAGSRLLQLSLVNYL